MRGKKKIKLCYIDSANLGATVLKAVEQLNGDYDDLFILRFIPLHTIGSPQTGSAALRQIEEADLVLVDIRGTNPLIDDILHATRKGKAVVVSLLGGNFKLMSLTRMGIFDANRFFNGPRAKNMTGFSDISGETSFDDIDDMLKEKLPGFIYKDIGAWFEVTRYWSINGVENIKRMLLMLARNYCHARRLPKALPPLRQPSPALRHPAMDAVYDNLREYLNAYDYDSGKATAVLIYYDGMHHESSVVPTASLISALEPDVNIVPISCDGIKNLAAIEKLAFLDGRFIGDIIVHLTWFRLNGGPIGGKAEKTSELLKKLNVPVYHPVTVFTSPISAWESSKNGISPVDYLANIVLPEMDGSVEPIILCASEEAVPEKLCQRIVAIEDRVGRCAGRMKRLLALKQMSPQKRRLALVVYNYPPGEHNLGNAAYLDSFKSVRQILLRLKTEGYTVGEVPDELSAEMLKDNVVNSPAWSERYSGALVDKSEYDRLSEPYADLRGDIEKRWGAFPGKVNVLGGKLRIPFLEFGNILVALQPSRGVHEDVSGFYHDKSIPPHHQYAAFYRWLDEHTDAIIHVGTHGTLEFLRGKEMTPSSNCDMDILLGDTPHFYIYQTGNPSEAMTAKRRAYATLVSYGTPAADSAGLYGEYLSMQKLFDEREDAAKLNPQRLPLIEAEIRKKADENGWSDLSADLKKIEERLVSVRRALIPVGLHTFGEAAEEEERLHVISAILRLDRGGLKSLNRVFAERDGLDYDKLLEAESTELLKLDARAEKTIAAWLRGDVAEPDLAAQHELASRVNDALRVDHELDGLINAFNGGYVGAGLSADTIKNPELLPSGRNLYQFDPLSLPTPSAIERGRIIAANTLQKYRAENGAYPKSVGVILWGFETAKTCGETVGQIMDYLGVRLKSEPGSWFQRVEPIPETELRHPRIDVMIQICGFFRDMFPNLLTLLGEAVKMVSKLDERDNAVRGKTVSIKEQLFAEGLSESEAEALSSIRVFGPPESEYGTSLTTMIETAAWAEESELGRAYENDMSYAYGGGKSGVHCAALNKLLLADIEMISQVQDTYEYDITDLDHYYEFFGGFAKAVENNCGRKPSLLTTNTAAERIRTEDAAQAVSRGAVTRTLNPKWIDAMLEHKYHGAQKIADRVQYQIGLSATTGSVGQWVWEKTAQTFVFDDKMRRRLMENNPYAANEIAKRLYEAKQRGYWEPTPEEAERLMQILMMLDDELEGEQENG